MHWEDSPQFPCASGIILYSCPAAGGVSMWAKLKLTANGAYTMSLQLYTCFNPVERRDNIHWFPEIE